MKHILLIELNSATNKLFYQLTAQGYCVHHVNNAFDALIKMETLTLDAILLDFAVPKMDSFWLLVARKAPTPVIVIADANNELERINALELGADDYLSHPVNVRELQLRLNVLKRRSQPPLNDTFCEQISFDDTDYTVHLVDKSLVLTQTEYRLFKYLFEHKGKVVTKAELQQRVLHKELGRFDRNLDMHISNTRRKLAQGNLPRELINTVRGQGYSFSF
ncbi:response regulator transcription factor [Shewanella inventionis]|uniref:DNA-binding response regulator n=1 Tax=Shewanella inventionis TaxID=1738770 RepID=A0ABQ1IRJ9_9GAMM|nr:response regulator transcription factor [Shewanella inventionis]MCL1158944.1 response regulator transcription factor [Shewanella inventionis]UAL41874.1 response regulator transcription factor [Shewanella inventionis]GGB48589.1 DNA-binding response regulator [Shewanella inventionis]